MEYPKQDRAGRVVDHWLELLKKTRRDHRASKAIANRIRIGLGLRHVGKRMQRDVPPEGLAVRTAKVRGMRTEPGLIFNNLFALFADCSPAGASSWVFGERTFVWHKVKTLLFFSRPFSRLVILASGRFLRRRER
jgi:hypothetical protein